MRIPAQPIGTSFTSWQRGSAWLGILLLVVGVLIGWVAGRGSFAQSGSVRVKPASAQVERSLSQRERSTVELFRNASPSVVYVTTVELARDMFSMNVHEVPRGSGTGFVWDRDGHIVTNFHVIQPGNRYIVRLSDQSEWSAKLVGIAPDKDLAVLRIEAPKDRLMPLAVGRSDNLEVGMDVFAIGNPFGLDQSLSTGIVSALGRTIVAMTGVTIYDMIQTDAAINPGNSGGPLLDSGGMLIGVNTAIQSPSGASAGIGFAVPVDTVLHIVPQLIEHGRVVVPTLGIRIAPLRLTRALRIRHGILVLSVIDGTAAEDAGLRGTYQRDDGRIDVGDIIIELDGRPIHTERDLYSTLQDYEPDEEVVVTFLRGQEEITRTVRLGDAVSAPGE